MRSSPGQMATRIPERTNRYFRRIQLRLDVPLEIAQMVNSLCARIMVRLPFPFYGKQTHMDFFFFQPCKVSKREANGPHPRFAVHMHMPIVQVNQFLLPRLSSFSIDSPDFIRNSRNIYTHFKRILVADFLHHLRTSHIAHHVGESLRSDVETTRGPSRLFSSEGAIVWGRDSGCEVGTSICPPPQKLPTPELPTTLRLHLRSVLVRMVRHLPWRQRQSKIRERRSGRRVLPVTCIIRGLLP